MTLSRNVRSCSFESAQSELPTNATSTVHSSSHILLLQIMPWPYLTYSAAGDAEFV